EDQARERDGDGPMRRACLAAAFALLAAPALAQPPSSRADATINVAVDVPPDSFPPPPLHVSIAQTVANEDVVKQLTTLNAYVGYQGPPGKSGTQVSYGPVSGMTLARLMQLAQVAPDDLVPGPGAVTITIGSGTSLGSRMTLSSQEVLGGFDDPCMS